MVEIIYKKNGIEVDGNFISLTAITNKCNDVRVKEDNVVLFQMEWSGWRGFDEGIKEEILLPLEKIEEIKFLILGKTIYFGEIAGKHSDVCNTLDDNDITITDDPDEIRRFLINNPTGHSYNYSFLHTFYDYAMDGGYDNVSEKDAEAFGELF